ncbi:hypothetical protein SDC9_130744 [bioreactor metagenome]|uniref:Uncharacterized protein n=1 Tax=bioreactor metagenome TaxID=1076179 RepID=A0A645D3E0_9ZZZZ
MPAGPLQPEALQQVVRVATEPVREAGRVTGQLEGAQRHVAALRRQRGRQQLVGAHPVDEERQLGIGQQALDAQLTPLELAPVGEPAGADGRLPAELRLVGGEVVDGHRPGHPAAARLGAGADDLSERRLLGGGMVQDLDDLDVTVLGERDEAVAGTEPRVEASVAGVHPERVAEELGRGQESLRPGGVREVVDMHGPIVRPRGPRLFRGSGSGSQDLCDKRSCAARVAG